MKKLLMIAMILVILVSCGKSRSAYSKEMSDIINGQEEIIDQLIKRIEIQDEMIDLMKIKDSLRIEVIKAYKFNN